MKFVNSFVKNLISFLVFFLILSGVALALNKKTLRTELITQSIVKLKIDRKNSAF